MHLYGAAYYHTAIKSNACDVTVTHIQAWKECEESFNRLKLYGQTSKLCSSKRTMTVFTRRHVLSRWVGSPHLAELHAPLPPGRKSPRSDHLVVAHVRKRVVGARQANCVQQTSDSLNGHPIIKKGKEILKNKTQKSYS